MEHSRTLEETKLWQVYNRKTNDYTRRAWIKEAYESACEQLKAVRDSFPNYTLHDETHVLNVLDIMAGLLGNRIEELKVGEAELLILVSAFHDLGMVYTAEEIRECLSDNIELRRYFSSHPDKRGKDIEDWDEFDKQDYLRWLHPFRVQSVLQQSYWQNLLNVRPHDIVSDNVIIAVCRAHGESVEELRSKAGGDLQYQHYKEVDPLFCVILLRLADIIDFDDSRAPSVLLSYSGRNSKSVEEWNKHISSMGFKFPEVPSTEELLYGARFTNPTIERAARKFLDMIDEELSNSRNLLMLTNERWRNFDFPYQVNRREIESVGYDFGDFKITMDQDRILDLLIGENIYTDPSAFVRELLQNSIDATLARAEMDSTFAEKLNTDEARIDLWEWWDDTGNLWFRIDDFGTGMTRGMIEKYFLKVGASYYNSQEINRDLNGRSFKSISRFGIGFLSCFLCGVEAYVSTTYWNSKKNIREADRDSEMHIEQDRFGLRLDVTGLNGYYTLKNQAIRNNSSSPLPSPPFNVPHPDENLEKDGYRVLPGTSIAIRIDSGKLGLLSLMNVARMWSFFPRMPIYYNGQRLGLKLDELVALAKEEQGVFEYEISDEDKQQLDAIIPELKGNYPRIRETIKLFEADLVPELPNLKVLLLETRFLNPNDYHFTRENHLYSLNDASFPHNPRLMIGCPENEGKEFYLKFESRDLRSLPTLLIDDVVPFCSIHYGWKGISAYKGHSTLRGMQQIIFVIDEDEARPVLKANRDSNASLPLKTAMTIIAWQEKNFPSEKYYRTDMVDFFDVTLKDWKSLFASEFKCWIDVSFLEKYQSFKKTLEKGINFSQELPSELSTRGNDLFLAEQRKNSDIRWCFLAYLQIHYKIVVNYSTNVFQFYERDLSNSESQFDLFPLMPFCYGDTVSDRSILCSAKSRYRMAITADHPFIIWLLKNAEKLNKFYPMQFNQIVFGLKKYNAEKLIKTTSEIIKQLAKTAYCHDIDTADCPELTLDDFKNYD